MDLHEVSVMKIWAFKRFIEGIKDRVVISDNWC